MKKIKIILGGLIATIVLWGGIFAYNFPYDYETNSTDDDNIEIGGMIKTDVIDYEDSIINKLLKTFNLTNQARYESGTSKAIYYAKMIVNMMLSFVGLIALVMLIYAFYMIFFSKEDSGVTKAKQMIKGILIAIVIMGLSRFIVSFLFWIQKGSANPNINVEVEEGGIYENQN